MRLDTRSNETDSDNGREGEGGIAGFLDCSTSITCSSISDSSWDASELKIGPNVCYQRKFTFHKMLFTLFMT